MPTNGPKVGEHTEPATYARSRGQHGLTVGGPAVDGRATLVLWLSPTCPVCKKLLPILKSASQAEKSWLDVVVASDGDSTQHLAFYRDAKLQQFPYVLSTDLGMTYRVSRLPYAVLLNEKKESSAPRA